jgi:hypothetical protein
MSLHNDNEAALVEHICHSFRFDLVIGTAGPLREIHIVVQISKSLMEDEFSND